MDVAIILNVDIQRNSKEREIIMEINIDGWNKVNKIEDCAPLNKKVLAIHDSKLYIATFEREGNEEYCWGLENERGLEWVDIFDVDAWISVENLGNTKFSDSPSKIRECND